MSGAVVVAIFACLQSQETLPLLLRHTIIRQPARAWIASIPPMVPLFLLWPLPLLLALPTQVLPPPAQPIQILGQEQTGAPVLRLIHLQAFNMDRRIRPSAPVETC